MPMNVPAAVTTRFTALKNVGDSATGLVTKLLASLDDVLGANNQFGTAAAKDVGTGAGNVPELDASGDLDPQVVPASIARLAGPTFTGDVQAPTPAADANDLKVATTAWVTAFAAAYAPLESPTFTADGDDYPKTAKPPSASNDDSVPTTGWVRDRITAATAAAEIRDALDILLGGTGWRTSPQWRELWSGSHVVTTTVGSIALPQPLKSYPGMVWLVFDAQSSGIRIWPTIAMFAPQLADALAIGKAFQPSWSYGRNNQYLKVEIGDSTGGFTIQEVADDTTYRLRKVVTYS